MSYSTGTTGNQSAVTLDDILKVKQKFDSLKLTGKWSLISPDGRMWQGQPTDLLQVLMPLHPLLQPLGFGGTES